MPTTSGKRPSRSKKDSSTQQHIVRTAALMLRETDKEHFHMAQLAERADVGVPTIYYYFASLNELVAHAQIINYVEFSRPVHSFDQQIADAFETGDEASFWDAIENHMKAVWQAGNEVEGGLGTIRVLMDIWGDEGAKSKLRAMMRDRITFWTTTARTAQEHGWLSKAQDPEVLIKVMWAASIGHGILGEDFFVADGDARVAAFSMRAMRFAGPED
jgi:AcrR family transcriptional regulator